MADVGRITQLTDDFRGTVQGIQSAVQEMIDTGRVPSTLEKFGLRHFFTPKHEKFGCCIYGREIFFPKGNLVIGKIHKHYTINFVMKGRVRMGTKDGPHIVQAPDIFVSGPGMQRIGIIEEDCLWATVHMVDHPEDLEKIEDELIAESYDELDLLYAERLGLEGK